jgi:phytoene desaturase
MKALVIGGGFGGLATAALLSRSNLEVTLIEKNKTLGGRARSFEKGGYKFDMGPSWYLMPEIFERYFRLLGDQVQGLPKLKKLDPSFFLYTERGKIEIHPDMSKNKEILNSAEPGGYDKFDRYLDLTSSFYERTLNGLLYKKFDGLLSMLSPSSLNVIAKNHPLRPMAKMHDKYFSSDILKYLAGFSSVFLGGDPSNIPSIYSMVNHSIFRQGVYYPEGGFSSLVNSFVEAGRKLGVKFITGEEVKSIRIEGRKVTSVITDNGEYSADCFIFNADYQHVDQNIIPKEYRNYSKRYWEKRDLSPSALLAYLGVKGKLDLAHHNIFIKGDWNNHFKSLKNMEQEIPEDFAFYASVRSKSDDSVSPTGNESLFILIPVSGSFNDKPEVRKKYIDLAIKRIELASGRSIHDQIEILETYCISDFSKDYNAFNGSAFGISNTLGQTAGLRPSMRSRKLKNIFYVGQYTHPGIGVPMTIIAAEIVSGIVLSSVRTSMLFSSFAKGQDPLTRKIVKQ